MTCEVGGKALYFIWQHISWIVTACVPGSYGPLQLYIIIQAIGCVCVRAVPQYLSLRETVMQLGM